jgi:hypothetical protein
LPNERENAFEHSNARYLETPRRRPRADFNTGCSGSLNAWLGWFVSSMNRIRKNHHTQHTRILALDVHPRSFGYVVMKSPDKLLHWGVRRSYQKTKSHPEVLVGGKLRPLLKIWKPDVIVTRVGTQRNKDVRSLFRRIKKEAGATSFLPITGTQNYYAGRDKYQRAVEMAARFPEIGWELPPKRKLGDSEHYLMSMFEALAIAVQYEATGIR